MHPPGGATVWVVGLWALAASVYFVAPLIVDRIEPTSWHAMHSALGYFLLVSSISWLALFAVGTVRSGRKVSWALVGFVAILYWDLLWLNGALYAQFA